VVRASFLLLGLVVGLAILLNTCGFDDAANRSGSASLETLVYLMTGSFSSEKQAQADSTFLDIRLEMAPIWTEREDGYWLYVEQAAASSLERPYRQRVYHVTQVNDSTFSSKVYEIENPLRFAGVWEKQQPLAGLSPDSLLERTGCEIILTAESDSVFVGSTVDKNCLSELRGASYATSEVRIDPTGMTTWDRGWTDTDSQVWGSESGGYRFDRVNKPLE